MNKNRIIIIIMTFALVMLARETNSIYISFLLGAFCALLAQKVKDKE